MLTNPETLSEFLDRAPTREDMVSTSQWSIFPLHRLIELMNKLVVMPISQLDRILSLLDNLVNIIGVAPTGPQDKVEH